MVAGRQQLSAPVRTCIGCRRRGPQESLVRVVAGSDGSLLVGRTLAGRGAWLCRDRPACVEAAAKRNAFRRALRRPVSSQSVQELLRELSVP
jgi:predicted RNA-binding protein YlxR (DUF448 family)